MGSAAVPPAAAAAATTNRLALTPPNRRHRSGFRASPSRSSRPFSARSRSPPRGSARVQATAGTNPAEVRLRVEGAVDEGVDADLPAGEKGGGSVWREVGGNGGDDELGRVARGRLGGEGTGVGEVR